MKRLISLVIATLLIVLGTLLMSANIFAEGSSFTVQDIGLHWVDDGVFEFGSYPQSQIKESDLIDQLNSIDAEWLSYNYYINSKKSDFMMYKDVTYNENKYRAVVFSKYRPNCTTKSTPTGYPFQKENGYLTEKIYWFKYEPLTWKVLNPISGLVMCTNIIDSQIYYHSTENRNINNSTIYANNWEYSDIRMWLNDVFYNTAFSVNQQNIIATTLLQNLGCTSVYSSDSTEDKLYLLSYNDVLNELYGFVNGTQPSTTREYLSTDYANSQGLEISPDTGYANWRLRTAGCGNHYSCFVGCSGNVFDSGYVADFYGVNNSSYGVIPAFNLDLNSKELEPFRNCVLGTHLSSNWHYNEDATCHTNGTKESLCDICGCYVTVEAENTSTSKLSIYKEDRVFDNSINWRDSYISISYLCEDCGYYGTKVFSVDEWAIKKIINPSCSFEGSIEFDIAFPDTFEENNRHYSINILKEDHIYIVDSVDEPTCTKAGTRYYKCTECGEMKTETIEALPHNMNKGIIKEATCIAQGGMYKVCSNCGFEEIDTVMQDKTPHNIDYKTTVTINNCYKETVKIKYCTYCGEILYCWSSGYPFHEELIIDEAIEPTCTTTGLTAGEHCSRCDYKVTQEVIPAKGHSETVIPAVVATCTSIGKTAGTKCSVCNKIIKGQTTVAKKAHTCKNVITKATISTDGKIVSACTICGKVSKTVVIPRIASISLSSVSYTYDGKIKTPTVNVKNSKGTTIKNGTDYTVTYASGRKTPGQYAVKITFKGNYSGSKTLYFTILPGVTSSIATATNSSAIKLAWKAVPGATGYRVYQYDAKTKKYVTLKTTTGTSYTVSKLKSGTSYKFAVKAYSTVNGKVYWASGYKTITATTNPGTPTLKVTAGSKKAALSWTKQTGATGYVVYMATSKNGKYSKIATLKGNSSVTYTKTGLTKGKTYYFKVAAYTVANGKTLYSSFSSVKAVKIK